MLGNTLTNNRVKPSETAGKRRSWAMPIAVRSIVTTSEKRTTGLVTPNLDHKEGLTATQLMVLHQGRFMMRFKYSAMANTEVHHSIHANNTQDACGSLSCFPFIHTSMKWNITSMKISILSLVLLSGYAAANTEQMDDSLIKGDISKAQFTVMAEKRFSMLDKNADGIATASEKAEFIAQVKETMALVGKQPSEWVDKLDPKTDSSKNQFMQTREAVFNFLDKNKDGTLSEAERTAHKEQMKAKG